MFVGSKKCIRNSTDCLRCLRVQKGADIGGEGAMFAGSIKCTRDGFECCHPERSEGSPPSQPKDNVTNLVIASRILPDMAISFAQCVMLSSAKHLLAGRLRGDSSLHSE